MKSDEMNQEELQAEIYAKAEHLCKSCAHHDFDCNTFIKTTSTIVLPEWKIVECSGYK